MIRYFSALVFLTCFVFSVNSAETKNNVPKETEQNAPKTESISLGGGCFWCLEAVFQRLDGVKKVVSGYAGGKVANPTYEQICTGTTDHAEVIKIEFNPDKIKLEYLLKIFWAAHDPTSVLEQDEYRHGKLYPKGTAYQGNDVGSQYRSAIYYETDQHKQIIEASKNVAQKEFQKPIQTEIKSGVIFYPAEDYHQNYYNLNKDKNPYCSVVITPKLRKLLQKGLIKE